LRFADKTGSESVVSVPFDILPLAVLKQILTMAMATTSYVGGNYYRDIRRFIMIPFERHLPSEYRVSVYFTPSEAYRLVGGAGVLRTSRGVSNFVIAEVA